MAEQVIYDAMLVVHTYAYSMRKQILASTCEHVLAERATSSVGIVVTVQHSFALCMLNTSILCCT
jgi:hypothetical protein